MNSSSLILERRAVEPFMKNAYIVGCPATGKAVYLDPGDEVEQLIEWFKGTDLQLEAVFLTHAHVDHISGVGRLRAEFEAPIYLHPEDRLLYEALPEQGKWFGSPQASPPAIDREFEDGQTIALGELEFKVHHTPGHSPGSVSLEVGEHVFCGDLIFAGSVGRTDLPGGNHQVLLESIRRRILPMGPEKVLHSGHGPDTSIERELRSNPFLVGLKG